MLKLSFRVAGLLLAIASVITPVSIPVQASQPPQRLAKTNTQPIRLEIQRGKRQVVVYQGKTKIKTYPIAVGKAGWETPIGKFRVQQMTRNPAWISPKTGENIPGGDPENPLGKHWIGFWTDGNNWIGFHGTPNPESVGTAASHGCIRMYNEDVEELFAKVSLGTEVTVVK
jgi:lipoprotein-anchoring transpeptidase ErfK/SrfK